MERLTLVDWFWDGCLGGFGWYRRWTGGIWRCWDCAPDADPDDPSGWNATSGWRRWTRDTAPPDGALSCVAVEQW